MLAPGPWLACCGNCNVHRASMQHHSSSQDTLPTPCCCATCVRPTWCARPTWCGTGDAWHGIVLRAHTTCRHKLTCRRTFERLAPVFTPMISTVCLLHVHQVCNERALLPLLLPAALVAADATAVIVKATTSSHFGNSIAQDPLHTRCNQQSDCSFVTYCPYQTD
jgi:hypothetical protein